MNREILRMMNRIPTTTCVWTEDDLIERMRLRLYSGKDSGVDLCLVDQIGSCVDIVAHVEPDLGSTGEVLGITLKLGKNVRVTND